MPLTAIADTAAFRLYHWLFCGLIIAPSQLRPIPQGVLMSRISINYARLDYLRRHLTAFWPYITPRKISNILLNEIEMRRRVIRPRSLPLYLKLEPTSLCQLKCPGCRHNDEQYNKNSNGIVMLTLENTKAIIEPLKHTLLGVSLSHLGEPFMTKELIPIIQYLHESRISRSPSPTKKSKTSLAPGSIT